MKNPNINPTWYNWPNREYARTLAEFTSMAVRCDVWRAFFVSPAFKSMNRMKGRIIWFNRSEAFDKLICEFPCSEQGLIKVLKGVMRRDCGEISFRRNDIYDKRAWMYLPLDMFVDVEGMKPRMPENYSMGYRHETQVLIENEMPLLCFSVPKPWVVEESCFTLHHRIREGRRFAEMTFAHPYLDSRFGKRWVADGWFAKETKRAEMYDTLLSEVKEKCVGHLVTITEGKPK